jgi:outer membrane PBP1 activator LpoA protein
MKLVKKVTLPVLVFAGLLLTACSSVTPQAKSLISTGYHNAAAFNNLAQSGQATPEDMKSWINEDVKSWKLLNDWANGKNPDAPATTNASENK